MTSTRLSVPLWCLSTLLSALVLLPHLARCADEDDPEPLGSFPRTTDKHRNDSANNLKLIGLAFHNFHDSYGRMPDSAIRDNKGKALLSWRVALLPFLEEDNLFKEFRLDEPWDSKHNKTLLSRLPKVYAPTITGKAKKADSTYYRVFTGPDTMFDAKRARGQGINTLGLGFGQITDGTSNTVMVVEASDPVLWTKPDELEYDAKKPIPKLGGLFKEGFHVLLCDGSVKLLDRKANVAELRRLINPNDGEKLNWNNLPEAKKK